MDAIYGGIHLDTAKASALLWVLPALPLLGAIACVVLGPMLQRRHGPRAVAGLAVGAMLAATIAAGVIILGRLLPLPPSERSLHQGLWPLFSVAGVELTFGLALDALSAVMIFVVTGVGTLIHLYAASYMSKEPSLPRFFAALNLFVFAMLLLVLADGFVPLMFGWEGVGVCSYLLIGFWHERPAAADAAMKAFVVNRVGDAGFLLGICLLLWGMGGAFGPRGFEAQAPRTVIVETPAGAAIDLPTHGERPHEATVRDVRIGPTLGFSQLAAQMNIEYGAAGENGRGVNPHGRPFAEALANKRFADVPLVFLVCVLLFLGAAGKSAQVPLSAWLPDAMAGPTPVSALIHAATMVTAGVYLIARLGFLFALSPGALTVIAVVGAATAFIGATAGCLQWDLKRVLAYSTVSQLGFMFAAVGAGAFSVGIFHVVTHAWFKACLFLAGGTVIHALHLNESSESSDPQDMRNAGGLAPALPWTRRAYLIACLAITGFPIASGFFSKDQIFSAVLRSETLRVPPITVLAALGVTTLLTAFYMFRSYFLVFYARAPRSELVAKVRETAQSNRGMIAVVLALAAGSIVVGPWLGWPRVWSSSNAAPLLELVLEPVFAPVVRFISFADASARLEWGLQLGGVALASLGALVARALYRDGARSGHWRRRAVGRFASLTAWVAGGWGFDDLYRGLIVLPALDFARGTAWLDRRIFDPTVDGVAWLGMRVARLVGAVDRRVVDGAVQGISELVLFGGRRVARVQSGRIGNYVLGIVAGIAVLVVLAYLLGS